MTEQGRDIHVERRNQFLHTLYEPRPDRRAPHARHSSSAMLGSLLSVARIPWLRYPIGAKIEWPTPRTYKTPLEIKCPTPAT